MLQEMLASSGRDKGSGRHHLVLKYFVFGMMPEGNVVAVFSHAQMDNASWRRNGSVEFLASR